MAKKRHPSLTHTENVEAILQEGGDDARKHAAARHNAHVDAELERAKAGETINLTDLMAAKEQLVVDAIERGPA